MKKTALSIIIVIFSINFISAVVITLDKSQYYPSELLKAEISGTFPDGLKLENIAIYQGNKVHPTPTESNLLRLENKYLYYALAPVENSTYALRITDTNYKASVGSQIIDAPIETNFTVVQTTELYLSISPGFISTTASFSISIGAINGIQAITAEFTATREKKSFELGEGAIKAISFSIDKLTEYTESNVKIGSYIIPVYVYPQAVNRSPFIPLENNTIINNSQNSTPVIIPLENATDDQIETCESIGGQLCNQKSECAGQTAFARGIICCLGECREKPKSSSWAGALALLGVLAICVWWFYYKIKKGRQKKPGEDIIEERTRQFQDRMYPNPKPEVRKGLSKI